VALDGVGVVLAHLVVVQEERQVTASSTAITVGQVAKKIGERLSV
jgi:hypothetical protein